MPTELPKKVEPVSLVHRVGRPVLRAVGGIAFLLTSAAFMGLLALKVPEHRNLGGLVAAV